MKDRAWGEVYLFDGGHFWTINKRMPWYYRIRWWWRRRTDGAEKRG